MVRVLITLAPRMYREAIALALRRSRPDSEVLLAVEVLYTDHMGVRVIVVGGRSYTIEDASMDDLISLVDEAEGLISG